MAVWDRFLTEQDRAVQALYGSKPEGFGKRPVVLVIDINYNFTGDKPEPILESIKRWRNSCGEEGWYSAQKAGTLVQAARAKRIPILFTTEEDQRADGWDSGRWADKNARRKEDRAYDRDALRQMGEAAVADRPGYLPRTGKLMNSLVAPVAGDILIGKRKPSAFFGTLLASYLIDLQADTILVCGSTTSGCVRATVIDGFSYNYRMMLVEECNFDRFEASHAIELFDMHMKYADVVSLEETLRYLEELPEGLFDVQMPSLARGVPAKGS